MNLRPNPAPSFLQEISLAIYQAQAAHASALREAVANLTWAVEESRRGWMRSAWLPNWRRDIPRVFSECERGIRSHIKLADRCWAPGLMHSLPLPPRELSGLLLMLGIRAFQWGFGVSLHTAFQWVSLY